METRYCLERSLCQYPLVSIAIEQIAILTRNAPGGSGRPLGALKKGAALGSKIPWA